MEPRILQTWLNEVDGRGEDALADLLHKEVQKWSHNCIDIDALQKRLARAEETCAILGNKVALLQGQLDDFRKKKINSYNPDERKTQSKLKNSVVTPEEKIAQQGVSSNAEDEGISSSERSSSPEDLGRSIRQRDTKIGSIDNDQETTIDDVIEELRIIVKDAEEEFEDRKGINSNSTDLTRSINPRSKISIESSNHGIENRLGAARISVHRDSVKNSVTYFGRTEEDLSVDSAVTRKLSSTSNDGSLKIVVKSSDVEDAIIPAILYPQPPRRAPPCLATILAREGDFLNHQVIYNPHDDEDVEEETLGDGSDSLLSASRLKYNSKNETNDNPNNPPIIEDFYQTVKKKNVSKKNLFDVNDDKKEVKTIRNFDGGKNMKNLHENDPTTKYLEVYNQFETINKPNEPTASMQRRGSKYKSEVEKRKLLRRSASQDIPASSHQSGNKIEGRIRKFETLNAFENSSLQNFGRLDDTRRDETLSRVNASKFKIQRSESFHHVSYASMSDQHSNRGGSDSGLLYVTDYDLEPLVNRQANWKTPSHSGSLLTKSLDRIDEGFDTVIDGAIQQKKRCQTVRSVKEQGKSSKIREDKISTKNKKSGLPKTSGMKLNPEKSIKNDELYNGLQGSSKLLRSDELYEDGRNDNRQWNFQNEVDGFKINNFAGNRNSMTIDSHNASRHESFSYDRMGNKFVNNDSGVFVPSGKYDAFGLGKNRFNAGKYSGQPQPGQENIGVRRNSAASLVAKRGKVTDILSGLY